MIHITRRESFNAAHRLFRAELSDEENPGIFGKRSNPNVEADLMKGAMASAENIAVKIWEQLEKPVKSIGAELHCVKLLETENNFVEYYGK